MAVLASTEEKSKETTVDDLAPIAVATLRASSANQLDLYTVADDGRSASLFRGRDYEVSSEDFEHLEAKGVSTLYVTSDDYLALRQRVRDNLSQIVADQDAPTTDRFRVLQMAVSMEVDEAFKRIDSGPAVAESLEVGAHLVASLDGGDVSPADLFSVMKHDYYTFTHLINVSSFSVMLARRMGYSDSEALTEIAVGGMLHDIGKRGIPAAILNKPGKLTDAEFDLIKTHPTRGYEDLAIRDDVTHGQLMMTYQHHERLDGTGYPVGLTSDEIHPLAKICAVVDIFDAVTSKRPYRTPAPMKEALELLQSIAGKHLEEELVRCWIEAISERSST